MAKRYSRVALGGTFDLLHAGHEKLLKSAFAVGQFVTIGITSDKFNGKIGQLPVQDQFARKSNISKFLKEKKLINRARLVYIEDIFGPTLVDRSYQALVVSKETLSGANKINNKRKQLGLGKLAIVTVDLVLAYDGKVISTTRIKAGEIDTGGRSYTRLLAKIAGKRLPDNVREKLKVPFGKIVKANTALSAKPSIMTVGDVATLTFNSLDIPRKLSIVDFLTSRKRTYKNLYDLGFEFANPTAIVKNPSGQISNSLIVQVSRMLKSGTSDQVLLVEGEEDLATICAIMLAPIPSTVFYGQPKEGLVMVDVNLDAKNRLCELLGLRQ